MEKECSVHNIIQCSVCGESYCESCHLTYNLLPEESGKQIVFKSKHLCEPKPTDGGEYATAGVPTYSKPTDKTVEDIVTIDKRFKKGVDYDYAELKYRGTPTISSDNRLWKEFEKVNICGCTRVCYGHDNLRKDIWNWILTHAKEIGNLI